MSVVRFVNKCELRIDSIITSYNPKRNFQTYSADVIYTTNNKKKID